jgi:hypothetical protein
MKDKNHLYRRAPAVEVESIECAPGSAKSLRSQPGPHEERERQYQRPGSEIKAGARMGSNRRRALIGRLVITNRRGAVTAGVFPRIADAAKAAARAPFAG